MFDSSHITRLISLALATCAVTWMLAASALAGPYVPGDTGAVNTAPAYKFVPGDTDKVPSASTAPAYQPQIGDALKTPDRAQVRKVLTGIGYKGALPQSADSSDDVDPLVVVLGIVAVLTALGAVTLIVTRRHRPVLPA